MVSALLPFRAMHSVVPAEVKYSWANATRSTMKLDKKYLENEDQSKIDYDHNGQTMYVIVNKDSVNKFGEQRGYRISPSKWLAPSCIHSDFITTTLQRLAAHIISPSRSRQICTMRNTLRLTPST